MTIGTGAQVQIGTDSPPVYSDWVTAAVNRVTNPSFEASSGTVTTRTNRNINPRFVGTANGAANVAGWSLPVSGTWGASDGLVNIALSSGINALLPYETAVITAAAGQTWMVSRDVSVPAGMPAVVVRLAAVSYTGGASGAVTYSPTTTIQPGQTVRLIAGPHTTTAGVDGMRSILYLMEGASAVARQIVVGRALVEQVAVNLPYFDGGTQPAVRENLATVPIPTATWYSNNMAFYTHAVAPTAGRRGGPALEVTRTVTSPSNALASVYNIGTTAWNVASRVPVVENQVISVSFYARGQVGSVGVVQLQFFNSAGVQVGGTLSGPNAALNPTDYTRAAHTVTVPASATNMGVMGGVLLTSGVSVGGEKSYLTDAQIEVAPAPTEYMDGGYGAPAGFTTTWRGGANASASYMYDSDFTPAWTGAANAATSILQGVGITGVLNGIRSTRWKKSGAYSARNTPTGTTTDTWINIGGDTGGMRLGMEAGKTYTILASFYQEKPQTGPFNGMVRTVRPMYRIGAGSYLALAPAALPNVAGEQSIRHTFTLPVGTTEAFIRMQNGSQSPDDSVWWDDVLVIEGEYSGSYIDGSLPDDTLVRYSWTGTANASTSTQEVRSLVSDGAAARWNIADYSVVEDSTPMDPSDTTGGFGQITVTLPEDADTRGLMNEQLVLTDGALGETTGTVRSLGGDGLSAQITANSRLGNLAVERTITPFVGTLTDCIEYHLGLCGITTGIVIDSDYDSINVKVPGGRENVYDRLLQMGTAYDFEMSLVSNNVVIRHVREREAINYRNASVKWSMDQSQLAQSVTGWYYNTYSGDQIAYPVQQDDSAMDVFQVDAGETKVYEVVLDASLSSVEQPTVTDMAGYASSTASLYAVSTMDGDTIAPSRWTSGGGSVAITMSEDTRIMTITVRGADIPELSPFRVATPDRDGNFTSAIRVRGTGVFWRKEQMTLIIHEDQDLAPDEVGAAVDVQFMETADQLYHRLLYTAQRYGTDNQRISVSTGGINRLGESGSARYATIGDVNAAFPGATISTIFTQLGPTIADWNAEILGLVSGDFANQAYGNVSGARVLYDHSYYRIRSATIRARDITYDAERDNTINDVYHYGETIAQWNTRWAGKTIRDVNIAPLIEEDAL